MTIAAAAFNSDLYVVGATVVPVLFIALVLPDGVLASYPVWVKPQRSLQLRRIRLQALRTSGDSTPHAVAVAGVFRIHDLLLLLSPPRSCCLWPARSVRCTRSTIDMRRRPNTAGLRQPWSSYLSWPPSA